MIRMHTVSINSKYTRGLIIITILYIILRTYWPCIFDQHLCHFTHALTSANHYSLLFIWVQLLFFNIPQIVKSHSISLSLSGLFHLAECPLGSSILLQMAGFPSFSLLNSIHCMYTYIFLTFPLSIYPLTDTIIFSTWLSWMMLPWTW